MKKIVKGFTISDIKPAEYNPRTMSDSARAGLSKSIEKFGDLSGITWNEKTRKLITGHQRWAELTSKYSDLTLKSTAPDRCEIVSKSKGTTGFFVRIVKWDTATEKAANITANNPNIQGAFDQEALQELLSAMEADFKDDLEGLMLEPLILKEWISDISVVEKTEENLDGIFSKITIICRPENKAQLIDLLKEFVEKLKIDGAEVDC